MTDLKSHTAEDAALPSECRYEPTVLSPEGWEQLQDLIENPPPPSPLLIEAMKTLRGEKSTPDKDMRAQLHEQLDSWFDEVSDNRPNGDIRESAKFAVEMFQDDYCTDEDSPRFDERLWSYTITKSVTSCQE